MTLRVLIADDSAIFVEVMRSALQGNGIEVCGIAHDGEEAVLLAERLRPDLISMDIEMPRLDGLNAVEQIMARSPTRILVLTGDPRGPTGGWTFEALRRGALDVMQKPLALARHHQAQVELVEKIRALCRTDGPRRRSPAAQRVSIVDRPPRTRPEGIGIVSSTGGPAALGRLCAALPRVFPLPVVVVQHLPPGFVEGFAKWLRETISLDVRIPKDGDPLEGGCVYLAPDGRHAAVDKGSRLRLLEGGNDRICPSGDELLLSMARAWGERAVGVVLTGMGRDGARGLEALRLAGGTTVAQDEATSVVYGMPKAAKPAAQRILPLGDIAPFLTYLAKRAS